MNKFLSDADVEKYLLDCEWEARVGLRSHIAALEELIKNAAPAVVHAANRTGCGAGHIAVDTKWCSVCRVIVEAQKTAESIAAYQKARKG